MASIKDFKNYDFESCDVPEKYWGDYTHANYFKKAFIPIARREFKALAKKMNCEIDFSPMYFEWSAFFTRNGKTIYVHMGDVRYSTNWYDNVLYRTARDNRDFSGGSNHYCSYDYLEQSLEEMFERM